VIQNSADIEQIISKITETINPFSPDRKGESEKLADEETASSYCK